MIQNCLKLPFLIVVLFFQCTTTEARPSLYSITEGWKYGKIDNVSYSIFVPESDRPLKLLLALPGWNLKATDWIHKTKLENHCIKHGYILLLLEMQKSLYASSYFPETTLKWHPLPGGTFIKSRFIPEMQKQYHLLKPNHANYLLGLSTGGRGVALIALENPDLFLAGSALSGDFDQSVMQKDRLMSALYGPYSRFTDRWTGQDNPTKRANEWKMPIYLAHGKKDRIVPYLQSQVFYNAIKKAKGKDFPVKLHLPENQAHDYTFWDSELQETFNFFESVSK